MDRLDDEAMRSLRAELPAWHYDEGRGGSLGREFVFAGFAEAFAFMTELALAAEKLDHHPEWTNVYDRVRVTLTTHDARGLTAKDAALARAAERAFARFAPGPRSPRPADV